MTKVKMEQSRSGKNESHFRTTGLSVLLVHFLVMGGIYQGAKSHIHSLLSPQAEKLPENKPVQNQNLQEVFIPRDTEVHQGLKEVPPSFEIPFPKVVMEIKKVENRKPKPKILEGINRDGVDKNLVMLLQKIKAHKNSTSEKKIHKPQVLEKFLPEYPLYAREKGIEGAVHLRVEILKDGSCGYVEVIGSNVDHKMTDEAVKAMSRWRFKPLIINGVSQESLAELKIKYGLQG